MSGCCSENRVEERDRKSQLSVFRCSLNPIFIFHPPYSLVSSVKCFSESISRPPLVREDGDLDFQLLHMQTYGFSTGSWFQQDSSLPLFHGTHILAQSLQKKTGLFTGMPLYRHVGYTATLVIPAPPSFPLHFLTYLSFAVVHSFFSSCTLSPFSSSLSFFCLFVNFRGIYEREGIEACSLNSA